MILFASSLVSHVYTPYPLVCVHIYAYEMQVHVCYSVCGASEDNFWYHSVITLLLFLVGDMVDSL